MHKEYDVSRAALSIFRHYFTLEENWTIVPEVRVEERKRPDYLIEQFSSDPHNHMLPKDLFKPKIAVELKSAKGDSFMKALDQLTSSMVTLVDDLGNEGLKDEKAGFAIFLILVKGRLIGFFEYHNDRSNLYEDSYLHHKGAVPFNMPQQKLPPGRPHYKGTGLVTYDDEYAATNQQLANMAGAFLDLEKDAVRIQEVLLWMKNNNPLSGPV